MDVPYDLGLDVPAVIPQSACGKARLRAPAHLLLAALGLGVCVDLLFHQKPLGVSVPLFTLLLVGALLLLGRREGIRPVRGNLWLFVPLFFFAGMVAVRANPFVTSLNVLACLLLLGLIAHFHAAGRMEALGLGGFLTVPLRTAGNALVRAAPLVLAVVNLPRLKQRGAGNLLPVLRGLLLALPVLIVFGALLASADLVFARYLDRLSRLEIPAGWETYVERAITIIVAAWIVAGGMIYALQRFGMQDDGPSRCASGGGWLGFVECATVLISVNALFGAFLAIQFAYLFGGQTNVLTDAGFTYAEYARRGFFELVAVAALTLALILGLHRITRRETGAAVHRFNSLASHLVALTLVLLASAFQRLLLYENAYGFTEIRLYVHVFMGWLAVALVWVIAALWLRWNRFALGGFVAAIGFLTTLNLINPDAFIARRNLARYAATGKLDAAYLGSLSDDALPVLAPATRTLPASFAAILHEQIRQRREREQGEARRQSWPSFHLAHWRAGHLIAKETTISVKRNRLQDTHALRR